MCKYVGIKSTDVDFTKPGWYLTHSWTIQQHDEFVEWLSELLYNDVQIRKVFMERPLKTKDRCRKTAIFFVFNYGWKILKNEKV